MAELPDAGGYFVRKSHMKRFVRRVGMVGGAGLRSVEEAADAGGFGRVETIDGDESQIQKKPTVAKRLVLHAEWEDAGMVAPGHDVVYCGRDLVIFQDSGGALMWSRRLTSAPVRLRDGRAMTVVAGVTLPPVAACRDSGDYIVMLSGGTFHLVRKKDSTDQPLYIGLIADLAAAPVLEIRAGAEIVGGYHLSVADQPKIRLRIAVGSGAEECVRLLLTGDDSRHDSSCGDDMARVRAEVGKAVDDYLSAAARDGKFCTPMLLSAAWRYADGTYSAAALPQLAVPCNATPYAVVSDCVADNGTLSLTLTILHRVCGLYYRLPDGVPDAARRAGAVALDFFATVPGRVAETEGGISGPVSLTPEMISVSGIPVPATGSRFTLGNYGDHSLSGGTPTVRCFRFTSISPSAVEERLLASSGMRLLSSVAMDDIAAGELYARISPPLGSDMDERPEWCPDFTLHCGLYGSGLDQTDDVLWVIGPRHRLPVPQPGSGVRAIVGTDKNGEQLTAECGHASVSDTDFLSLPRMIFYPDPDAHRITMPDARQNSGWSRMAMRRCGLGCAVASFGLSVGRRMPEASVIPVTATRKAYAAEGNFMSARPGKPLSFSGRSLLQAGSAEAIAVCVSTRPLSSGQFGEFPLYAFTADGVWALASVGESGAYRAVQRLSAHRCVMSADRLFSVAQLPSGAVFRTRRSVVVVSGSALTEICNPDDIPEEMRGFPLMADETSGLLVCGSAAYSQPAGLWNVISGREGIRSRFYDENGNIVALCVNGTLRRLHSKVEEEEYTVITDAGIAAPDICIGIADVYAGERVRVERTEIDGGDMPPFALAVYGSSDGRRWRLLGRSAGSQVCRMRGSSCRYLRIAAAFQSAQLPGLIASLTLVSE